MDITSQIMSRVKIVVYPSRKTFIIEILTGLTSKEGKKIVYLGEAHMYLTTLTMTKL